ncbi:LD-carboxypeptidase [Cytophagaceae bacterium ABcell3]|nr:LD-carboxypeptidase [Cytophagaceae bacterium ABcell3]
MHNPDYLKQGDKIAIVATAKKFEFEELAPGIETIKSWGLEVILGENTLSQDNQFAGTDAERLQDLQHALDNPEIKAILCARGGYGTSRIIDKVDFSKFRASPKWIAGFSDVTVLLNHIAQWQIPSLHAPMPVLFAHRTTSESLAYLRQALFGEKLSYEIAGHKLNREGVAEARLIGGNLSILCTLTGTSSEPDTAGKILFLEDIDEYMYQLDRMMVMLKRSGKLSNLAGLIVGHFSDMKDGDIPFGKTAYEIIADHVSEYAYPVCYGFPAGHEPENYTLAIGKSAALKVSETYATIAF